MTVRTVKLGDVIEINPRSNHSLASDSNVAFLAMADISEDGQILATQTRPLSKVAKGYTSFQNGDVLLAKITPCFENGKAALVHGMFSDVAFGSTEFHVLRPTEEIDGRYLYHLVWNPAFRAAGARRMTGSAGQKRVPTAFLSDFEIALPRFEEQKRIAAILDKADSLRGKRQQAIRLADDFLRAVFLDMFGDPITNPKGWPVVKLGGLAKSDRYAIKAGPFGSALKKAFYVSSGYRIYGQEQVIRDDLTFGDYYIDEEKYRELESCKVESGDMLISLVGTFGKICIVPPDFEPGIINPRLMKISFDPLKATPRFMKALLTTDSMVRRIESLSHGGTMGIVNVGIMKDLDVPVPPVAIQIRFEEMQEKLSTLRTNHDEAEEQTTLAFSALQSRFFS